MSMAFSDSGEKSVEGCVINLRKALKNAAAFSTIYVILKSERLQTLWYA